MIENKKRRFAIRLLIYNTRRQIDRPRRNCKKVANDDMRKKNLPPGVAVDQVKWKGGPEGAH
jgi:hypothetical protein